MVSFFQNLTPGQCIWIVPKNSVVNFYVGTFVGFDCGTVLLRNAFTNTTFVLAILSATGVIPPTLTPPLPVSAFAGSIVVNLCDISSAIVLNGEFCTFLNALITSGTITNASGMAIIAAISPGTTIPVA